jgi:hypothetical protein
MFLVTFDDKSYRVISLRIVRELNILHSLGNMIEHPHKEACSQSAGVKAGSRVQVVVVCGESPVVTLPE